MIYSELRTVLAFILLTCFVYGSAQAQPSHTESNRIITAGGSLTEIMFELGLGEQIVAVDSSSFYPSQTMQLPKVGYFRSLAAEGIMSLNPDTVVAAKGAGPKVVLEQIGALGVDVKTYNQSTYTLGSWEQLVKAIGNDFGKIDPAHQLIARVKQAVVTQQAERKYTNQKVNAISLLSIGQRGPVAAGSNTVPDLLMQLAGVNNVASDLDGYKPFSTELLAEQSIDMVLVPSHVVDGLGGKTAICENQIIKLATANQCNLHIVDVLLLMGFGTRLDKATGQLIDIANGV